MNEYVALSNTVKGIAGNGGFCEVLAVPEEGVMNFPLISPDQTVTEEIQLYPGFSWNSYVINSGSRAFSEEQSATKSGLLYTQVVSGRLYDQGSGNHILFNNMALHRWIVLVKERKTGLTYLIGKPDAAAYFSLKYDSSKGTVSEISFTNTSKYRALIYAPPVDSVPIGVFEDQFEDQFE
ncbi:hypothetical protein QEG73_21995 [Chitinophagaceae bacterium 26-R-25]|nr:hypothetical protein [Chitinophagaceae bacterium 26-R-25]